MGADKVVCIDQSQGLIDKARASCSYGQYFLFGDISNCSTVLEANYSEINIMVRFQFNSD